MLLYCHACTHYFHPSQSTDPITSTLKCSQCQSDAVEIIPDADQPELFSLPFQFFSGAGATNRSESEEDDEEVQSENEHEHNVPLMARGSFPPRGVLSFHQLFSLLRMLSTSGRASEGTAPAFNFADMASMYGIHGDPRDYAFGGEEYNAILQQLYDQASAEKGTKPASEAAIAQLVRTKLSEGKQGSECNICKDAFAQEASLVQLPCGHEFHEECGCAWLRVSGTCPVCRRDLASE